ncbi:MAG: hypothetical protein AUJ71_03610 [Candidatus Omnitrophica bacterium CG1_02_49_16]|nr:MAG: hypothetical protein AUJ71_03610 [Candidatus Omnitrophica bacterium CG1_02_49_16]
MHRRRTLVQSLNNAVEGVIYVIKNERNMRIHFLLGFLVLLAAIFIGVSRFEWVVLCTIVSLVLAAEMINTVVEELLDMVEPSPRQNVRVIKDISAGFVLVIAINASVAGYFIFCKYWSWPIEMVAMRIRHTSWQITFVALWVAVFLAIMGKVIFHRGTPFRGGIISGHSAVAFAIWTAVLFTYSDLFVLGATFLLAALVAQSRLRGKIHSSGEVIRGAVLGFLVTALFFKIFK